MSARQATYALMQQLGSRGISLSFDEVNTLRRAQMTLHRWAELECGDSNEKGSWVIERDKKGVPYLAHHYYQHGNQKTGLVVDGIELVHGPRFSWTRIPDREAGALRRVKAICQAHNLKAMSDAHNLYFYHQTDPRGCALYISNEPLPDHNYTRGVACCA